MEGLVKEVKEPPDHLQFGTKPLAVDTLGGWHKEALAAIGKLGRQLARVVGRDKGETVQHLRQQLGVLLVRDRLRTKS